MSPAELTAQVKAIGRRLGFERVRIANADPVNVGESFREWLRRGFAGEMDYLDRNIEQRLDPSKLAPGAKSVICVGLSYHRRAEQAESGALFPGPDSSGRESGRIAMYARGTDYHRVMKRMLRTLVKELRSVAETAFDALVCVDSAPVMERELARRAGIGWVGKHTLILHETLGSYLFLGEIISTLELVPDDAIPDRCGTCTRCLDACPASAFPQPHLLDATKCISYLTIEHRSEIPESIADQTGDWVFGCDVCQEVCPFNRKAPEGSQPEIMATILPARVDLEFLLRMSSGDHKRLRRVSAAARAPRMRWRRNARNALRNFVRARLHSENPPGGRSSGTS